MEILIDRAYRFGAMAVCGFCVGTLLVAIFTVVVNMILLLL